MTQCVVRTVMVLSLLALPGEVIGQKRPDFSGTWVLVTPNDSAGQKLTITPTLEAVKLEYSSARGKETVTYNLDATPTRRTVRTTLARTAQVMSKASWKDGALVIEERYILEGRPFQSKLVLSVDRTGRLVLVQDRPLLGYADTPIEFPEGPRKFVFLKQ
jgi:hypothetical protein